MKALLTVAMMMAAGSQAWPPDCEVIVYTKIGLMPPQGTFLDARLRTAAMFREIGMNVHVVDGIPKHMPGNACGEPIVVQIEISSRFPVPEEALAYALPYLQSGTCIHVFSDRVLRQRISVAPGALLAHVMAHEITHVLQRMQRHSESGKMKARWTATDYQDMERHALAFAPEDVEMIVSAAGRKTHIMAQ